VRMSPTIACGTVRPNSELSHLPAAIQKELRTTDCCSRAPIRGHPPGITFGTPAPVAYH